MTRKARRWFGRPPTRQQLRTKVFAKFRSTGITDRADRLMVANQLLGFLFPHEEGEIESFNDMTMAELEDLYVALLCWEIIQEARLYSGTLHVDNAIAKLSEQRLESALLENTQFVEAINRAKQRAFAIDD